MTGWLIVRTDRAKEEYVKTQIEQMGYEAWVPAEKRFVRIHALSKKQKIVERPILPKRLFAAVPVVMERDLLGIRHLAAIERGSDYTPLQIAGNEVAAFRRLIDQINEAFLALTAKPLKKEKARWRPVEEAFAEMKRRAARIAQEAA